MSSPDARPSGDRDPPHGYRPFTVGGARVVALDALAGTVRAALGPESAPVTLYAYAARHPRARPLLGRAVAYAVPLPDAHTRVVVRRSRHGGLLAPLTGDRFLPPTRAPHELRIALRLEAAGIPTPEVVAYATYPAGPVLRRSDVATREISHGRDLAVALLATIDPVLKREMLEVTATLLRAMAAAGARHPDLNLKNVLLAPDDADRLRAIVLDVDRVRFGAPGDPSIGDANFERLARSARKWRELYGAAIDEDDLRLLREQSAR